MAKKEKSVKGSVDSNVDTASIQTPSVNIEVERTSDGELNIDIDTERVDVEFSKKGKAFKLDIEINDKQVYEVVSNGKSKHLKNGKVFKVIGVIARILLKKGVVTLKD